MVDLRLVNGIIAKRFQITGDQTFRIPQRYIGVPLINERMGGILRSGHYARSQFVTKPILGSSSDVLDIILIRERVELNFSFSGPDFVAQTGESVSTNCVLHLEINDANALISQLMDDRGEVRMLRLRAFLQPHMRRAVNAFIRKQPLHVITDMLNMPEEFSLEFDFLGKKALTDSGWTLKRIQDFVVREHSVRIFPPPPEPKEDAPPLPPHDSALLLATGAGVVFAGHRKGESGSQVIGLPLAEGGILQATGWQVDMDTRINGLAVHGRDGVLIARHDGQLDYVDEWGQTREPLLCGSSIKTAPLVMGDHGYAIAWRHESGQGIGSYLVWVDMKSWQQQHSRMVTPWQVHLPPVTLGGWIFVLDRKSRLNKIHPYTLASTVIYTANESPPVHVPVADVGRKLLWLIDDGILRAIDGEGRCVFILACPEIPQSPPLLLDMGIILAGKSNLYLVEFQEDGRPGGIVEHLSFPGNLHSVVPIDGHRFALVYQTGHVQFVDVEADVFHDSSFTVQNDVTPTAVMWIEQQGTLCIVLSDGVMCMLSWN